MHTNKHMHEVGLLFHMKK